MAMKLPGQKTNDASPVGALMVFTSELPYSFSYNLALHTSTELLIVAA